MIMIGVPAKRSVNAEHLVLERNTFRPRARCEDTQPIGPEPGCILYHTPRARYLSESGVAQGWQIWRVKERMRDDAVEDLHLKRVKEPGLLRKSRSAPDQNVYLRQAVQEHNAVEQNKESPKATRTCDQGHKRKIQAHRSERAGR